MGEDALMLFPTAKIVDMPSVAFYCQSGHFADRKYSS